MSNVNLQANKRVVGGYYKRGLLDYILRAIMKNPSAVIGGCVSAVFMTGTLSWSARGFSFPDSCVVNDTVIRLGDIARTTGDFPDSMLEKLAAMPIGESAPAGYSRYVNTRDLFTSAMCVRFPMLGPVHPQEKRVCVRTGFQEKTVGEFTDSVESYLREKIGWPAGTYTVLINNKTEKWKCLPKPFAIKIDGLLSKYPKGNVNLKLIAQQGPRQYVNAVSCFIKVIVPVVVSKTNLPRGTLLTSENCSIEEKDITHYKYIPYNTIHDIENTKSSRAIQAGTIIYDKAIFKIPVIERDDQVQIVVTHGRVRICMWARARESGSVGGKIWVENEMTHKLLKTRILSHGKVLLLDEEGTI